MPEETLESKGKEKEKELAVAEEEDEEEGEGFTLLTKMWVEDEGLEGGEMIPVSNKAKITLASHKEWEQALLLVLYQGQGVSMEGTGAVGTKKKLPTDAVALAQQVAMVEAAKAHLAAKGLSMAYYLLKGGKKAKSSCCMAVSPIRSRKRLAVKSKKFVESEGEEET
ncbi:hypothetical protein C0995_004905 [Termitomyces sp. Mi166|nr:hypothetical protein C0995_004905 [Termitomyces sp. Mi166\